MWPDLLVLVVFLLGRSLWRGCAVLSGVVPQAVVALSKLGPMSIHNLVLPNLKTYMVPAAPSLLSATRTLPS